MAVHHPFFVLVHVLAGRLLGYGNLVLAVFGDGLSVIGLQQNIKFQNLNNLITILVICCFAFPAYLHLDRIGYWRTNGSRADSDAEGTAGGDATHREIAIEKGNHGNSGSSNNPTQIAISRIESDTSLTTFVQGSGSGGEDEGRALQSDLHRPLLGDI